jgi:hypothetical protein
VLETTTQRKQEVRFWEERAREESRRFEEKLEEDRRLQTHKSKIGYQEKALLSF